MPADGYGDNKTLLHIFQAHWRCQQKNITALSGMESGGNDAESGLKKVKEILRYFLWPPARKDQNKMSFT
jgi:hypothetical protein